MPQDSYHYNFFICCSFFQRGDFQPGVVILLSGDAWQHLEIFLVFTAGEGRGAAGIEWAEAEVLLNNILPHTGQAPPQRAILPKCRQQPANTACICHWKDLDDVECEGPAPRVSGPIDVDWGSRTCISNKFLTDAKAAGTTGPLSSDFCFHQDLLLPKL